MSDQTLEAPSLGAPADTPSGTQPVRPGATPDRPWLVWVRRHPWILGAAVLLVISLLVVLWARSRPGYDPYGWLVWGKLTLKGALDTNGAPSWKPLPFLFTVPFSLFGHYALWLWMVFSVAVSLAGLVFAWRIAFRLVGADPARRYAAYAAGLFAALALLGMEDVVSHLTYTHYLLSAESDTMIVALVLAAVDLHLTGRHKWAFWMWWLAALGRPEVWPFLGLVGIWLWFTAPEYRRWLYFSLVAILFMWFVIPGLTSKSFFTAGNIAHNSPREVHGNKIKGTISRFHALESNTVWILAAFTVALAAWRRWWAILALAAGALGWLIIEIGFSIKGYPSVPRYMFESGAVVVVLAAVGVGRLILDVPPLVARVLGDLAPGRVGPRLIARVGGWAAAVVVVAVAGSMVPAARTQYRLERLDLRHERSRATLFDRLRPVVDRLTPARILACGQPNIPIGYQSVFAWYMGIKTGVLYVNPSYLAKHPHPLVSIYPTASNGWKVFPSHIATAAQAAHCHRLRLTYR